MVEREAQDEDILPQTQVERGGGRGAKEEKEAEPDGWSFFFLPSMIPQKEVGFLITMHYHANITRLRSRMIGGHHNNDIQS